jgi:2',3'-cyclic-nucleotide 2'-phosphodiesterase (5'-nucleotidase family)
MKRTQKTMVLRMALILLAAAIVFAGCAGIGSKKGGGKAPFSGTIQIVHVNDTHTWLNEDDITIGFAKIAAIYDDLKAKNPNTLFLNAGDCYFGTPNGVYDRAESLMPILNTVGFDVMVAGNHEFSYGSAQIIKLAAAANYPVICANMVYKATNNPIFPEYWIATLPNGMKIGIIGLTTSVSAAMGANDLKYVDAVALGQKLVDEVTPQADLVIGLFHIGEKPVGNPAISSLMIADEVEGFDLIIDGHSHTKLPNGMRRNGVLIAQTGEYCQNIGIVDLTIENGKMTDSVARLITKAEVQTLDIEPKEETARLIEDFNKKAEAFFNTPVGMTAVDLASNGASRLGETNIGSFYADVMRSAASELLGEPVDAGLFKAGPIGGGIQAGPLTMKDLITLTRVDSQIIVKRMTGAQILEFINYSTVNYPAADGNFVQISGIAYKLDPAPDSKGNRAFDVRIGNVDHGGGEPLDLKRLYNVAIIMGSDEEPGANDAGAAIEIQLNGQPAFSLPILQKYFEGLSGNKSIAPQIYGRIKQEERSASVSKAA